MSRHDVSDVDLRDAEQAFRPAQRPMTVAVLLNGLLAITLLGIPYFRGRARCDESVRAFAAYAACVYGRVPRAEPGIALPLGDRDRFASLVETAGPEWPLSCEPALRAIAQEEVIFLMPSPKQAEAQVRAAVDLVATEMEALAEQRRAGLGRVPERPLLAVSRLRAAMSELLVAADIDVELDRMAITWPEEAPALATPSRVPLRTAMGGLYAIEPDVEGVHVVAGDSRGVAEVRARSAMPPEMMAGMAAAKVSRKKNLTIS